MFSFFTNIDLRTKLRAFESSYNVGMWTYYVGFPIKVIALIILWHLKLISVIHIFLTQ